MTSMRSSSGEDDVLASSSLARRARGGSGARGGRGPGRGRRPSAGGARPGAGGLRWSPLVRHDLSVALRQVLPLMLAAVVLLVVAMPVSTAAIPDVSILNLDYTHDQMKFRFWLDDLTYPVVLGVALLGVALGMRAFGFLLAKREATAVLSLPLPRATLFATRAVACAIALVLGIGLPLAASLVANVAALGVWPGLFGQFAYVLCGLLLTGGVACAVGVVACAVAGTSFEAASLSAALLSGVSVAAWGVNAVMDWMLLGNAFGERLSGGLLVSASLVDVTAPANPLLFFAGEAARHHSFVVQHPVYYPLPGSWGPLALWLLALVALVALGCLLVCRRRGEAAGIAGLGVALPLVVGVVVGLAAFGATFTLVARVGVAAAVVASFAVFLAVSLALLLGPFRGRAPMRRTMSILAAETAVLACVMLAIGTGGLGYSSAVPAADEVESASVSYAGSPSYLATRLDEAKAGNGPYYYHATYRFEDPESIEIVRSVHEQLISSGSSPLGEDRLDFPGSVMPYDVVVRYAMRDGRQVVRYYDRAPMRALGAICALDGTAHGRELARAAVSGDLSALDDEAAAGLGPSPSRQAFARGDIYVSDRLYANPMLVSCDAQARVELLSALAQDVAEQDVEDRYHPRGTCRGVLMFSQAGQSDAESFSYNVENSVVYLTDEFRRTLGWLEEKGLGQYLSLEDEASAVGEVTVQRYAPFDGMNAFTDPQSVYFMGYRATTGNRFFCMQDFGTRFSTDDPAQVRELLGLARNAYYLDGGAFLVSVRLAGQQAYTYLAIPADEAPEWLVRAAS
ncbi:hypothetical protein [Olsenella phocaeensis]|uniref:hypothetical protein n=1 Tax=Olsenella phocaeensis TaxID=1852385 RepID=UPI003A926414